MIKYKIKAFKLSIKPLKIQNLINLQELCILLKYFAVLQKELMQ